jgi:hypothetical protein
MVWIEKVCSINSEKIDVLPMFSRTVGEMVNVVIEDHMSIVTDLAKSMGPSIANEAMRVANAAYFGVCNFSNIISIEHAIEIVGLQEAKENKEHAVIISLGNMFAKKINIEDNFSCFDEFINKYRYFCLCYGRPWDAINAH